jgi:predicted metal-dependent TIM-barrel fold hydrolase
MQYIDPHIHMISRTTDDYQRMAYAQCAAISEPAFWAGFDRGTAAGFHDYFRTSRRSNRSGRRYSTSGIMRGFALTRKRQKT